ncbi:MAG TPA: tyrosine-type recombinase/integrase [Chloroflexota bacterium]|jgi:site-specific recombinase XerD|nr:tyrosine-type recombinase/integrase [Chloroflexota bacterium]
MAGVTVDEAIERFLRDLEVGRSPATVATYRSVLRRFAEFLDGSTPRPATVEELTADHPVDFARWVSDGGRAPRTTVQLYTTAVTRLYAYLVREDLRPELPLPKIQLRLTQLRGKRPKRLPKVPTDELMERIVAAAHALPPADTPVGERRRLRNVAVVETLRGSGVRVSELVSLRRGDLDRENRRAVVTGKGDKQRLVFFTDAAWRAIWAYLEARGDGGTGRGLAALPVFARHDQAARGRPLPLTTQSVRDVVWDLARRAGASEMGITPHRFRAWFATRMVAETGDLAATQDLLGHESADTTRVYTKVAAQRLAEAHRRAFAS